MKLVDIKRHEDGEVLKAFSKDQQYLIKESIRELYYNTHYKLNSLSADDYNLNGHNIESDIDELENIMIKLNMRY